MADRNPSFFGPVLPASADSPPAFSPDQLQTIQARRFEADHEKMAPSAFPPVRRFTTLLPPRIAAVVAPASSATFGGTPKRAERSAT
jgi:hypothetical protein